MSRPRSTSGWGASHRITEAAKDRWEAWVVRRQAAAFHRDWLSSEGGRKAPWVIVIGLTAVSAHFGDPSTQLWDGFLRSRLVESAFAAAMGGGLLPPVLAHSLSGLGREVSLLRPQVSEAGTIRRGGRRSWLFRYRGQIHPTRRQDKLWHQG